MVDVTMVEEAHEAGLAVYVYTVDPEEEMHRVLALGVDGLFTNRARHASGSARGATGGSFFLTVPAVSFSFV